MAYRTMKKGFLYRRLVLTIILMMFSVTMTTAQTNPKPGFIITNNGDTIRGVIDFRTNEKLSKQCDFCIDAWPNYMII